MKGLVLIFLLFICKISSAQWYDNDNGHWVKFDKTYLNWDEFTDTIGSINIYTLDTMQFVHASNIRVTAEFTGPSLTDISATLHFLTVAYAQADSTIEGGDLGDPIDPLPPPKVPILTVHSNSNIVVLNLTLTTTGCNLSDLTYGTIAVYLYISRLPE